MYVSEAWGMIPAAIGKKKVEPVLVLSALPDHDEPIPAQPIDVLTFNSFARSLAERKSRYDICYHSNRVVLVDPDNSHKFIVYNEKRRMIHARAPLDSERALTVFAMAMLFGHWNGIQIIEAPKPRDIDKLHLAAFKSLGLILLAGMGRPTEHIEIDHCLIYDADGRVCVPDLTIAPQKQRKEFDEYVGNIADYAKAVGGASLTYKKAQEPLPLPAPTEKTYSATSFLKQVFPGLTFPCA